MNLLSLPNEILANILVYCDLKSLFAVIRTCTRLNLCANAEIVWKSKWLSLTRGLGIELALPTQQTACFKDMCRRFVGVFGTSRWQLENDCAKCQLTLCDRTCIDDKDEVIIFDFGSKTTWFKYASESTGQLSMHPTVAPLVEHAGPSETKREETVNESCPICAKIVKKRMALGMVNPIGKVERTEPRASPWSFSAAFSKLSFRGLQCFDTSHSVEDEDLATILEAGCAVQMLENSDLKIYQFLMKHMLKRNPFFLVKTIPFIFCEPIGCTRDIKKQLVKFAFRDLKVPALCFVPKALAAALYIGLDTCLVIDSGAHNTVVTPVVDQVIQSSYVQHIPLGGSHLTKRLAECIRTKGIDNEFDESSIDSSQVKRECYLAYNPASENKKKLEHKSVTLKGHRNQCCSQFHVRLGHELYLAAEDMYINIDLPGVIKACVAPLSDSLRKKLLSQIVLTGGNCRLNGLAVRLTKDLQESMPDDANVIRVCDPRLMTGRTDVVIGASYIKKWEHTQWITRKDYIIHGGNRCLQNLARRSCSEYL